MADLRIRTSSWSTPGRVPGAPIDGLSLDVGEGSLAILLGPSGCGKTTLLSCLGGILSPSAGRIEFGDIDLTKLDERELSRYRRHTVGIVFQAFNLVPSLTALENVMVPLRAARVPHGEEARTRAAELLDRVGLAKRMGHRPATSAAASSSGSRWPARSPWIPRCSWPTSPPRTWTTSRSRRCSG